MNPHFKNTINLKIELIRLKLSQRDLSRALNLSPQLISGVVTGRIKSLPTEIKIIKYLREYEVRTRVI